MEAGEATRVQDGWQIAQVERWPRCGHPQLAQGRISLVLCNLSSRLYLHQQVRGPLQVRHLQAISLLMLATSYAWLWNPQMSGLLLCSCQLLTCKSRALSTLSTAAFCHESWAKKQCGQAVPHIHCQVQVHVMPAVEDSRRAATFNAGIDNADQELLGLCLHLVQSSPFAAWKVGRHPGVSQGGRFYHTDLAKAAL